MSGKYTSTALAALGGLAEAITAWQAEWALTCGIEFYTYIAVGIDDCYCNLSVRSDGSWELIDLD